jgi:hypothetical protein
MLKAERNGQVPLRADVGSGGISQLENPLIRAEKEQPPAASPSPAPTAPASARARNCVLLRPKGTSTMRRSKGL